jgi:hypothetical protein
MSETIITSLTLESLRDTLQQTGYRVETLTDPVANIQYLRSATAGVAFDVRPGNPLPGTGKSFADVAFVGVLQIVGELPLDVVNRWNTTRRFGRLQLSPPFLVFSLDVAVLHGVTPAHLRAQIQLWDGLVQDLVPFLRNAVMEGAQQKAPSPQTNVEPHADKGAAA